MEAVTETSKGTGAQVAFLGLGSSLGDRPRNLREALRRLESLGPGVKITAVSPVYESPHLGLHPGDAERYPAHLNCVVQIETTLPPEALLERVQAVEAAGQRQRNERWGPRTIDVDILLYGNRTLRTETLTLPHPGLAERAFVVVPLVDLAPDLRLPDGRKVADLLRSESLRAQRMERVAGDELLL